jgi:hypothetical protein
MGYPVEIKANVEQESIDDALSKLQLKDEAAEKRSIYFCENGESGTPLNEQGVILRVRRSADDRDKSDVTLKLRPCVTAKLPPKWSAPSEGEGWEFRIELDWSGDQDPVISASLVRDVTRTDADKALNGDPDELLAVLSADQLELCQNYTGVPLDTSTLRPLGPVESRKWKFKLGERKLNVEEWVIPDTPIRFLELSDREDNPNEAKATRQTLLDLCETERFKLSTSPELKTKIVLDHFARDPEAPDVT